MVAGTTVDIITTMDMIKSVTIDTGTVGTASTDIVTTDTVDTANTDLVTTDTVDTANTDLVTTDTVDTESATAVIKHTMGALGVDKATRLKWLEQ